MIWREIRQSGEFLRHLPDIWERELGMPGWFQSSSFLWTPRFAVFAEWACEFPEIYGYFVEGDKLAIIVYVEKHEEGRIAVVHLSVLEKTNYAAALSTLRDRLFHNGARYIRGWVLTNNFRITRLLKRIGFRGDGFTMDRGHHRGQVLRWQLMEIVRG